MDFKKILFIYFALNSYPRMIFTKIWFFDQFSVFLTKKMAIYPKKMRPIKKNPAEGGRKFILRFFLLNKLCSKISSKKVIDQKLIFFLSFLPNQPPQRLIGQNLKWQPPWPKALIYWLIIHGNKLLLLKNDF